jgi:hypothetical protein
MKETEKRDTRKKIKRPRSNRREKRHVQLLNCSLSVLSEQCRRGEYEQYCSHERKESEGREEDHDSKEWTGESE